MDWVQTEIIRKTELDIFLASDFLGRGGGREKMERVARGKLEEKEFFNLKIIIYVYGCFVYIPVCVTHIQCLSRQEEDIRSPGTIVTVSRCYVGAGN